MENLHNQKNNEKLVAISEKYMLTIREAGSYFNIGIKNMRNAASAVVGYYDFITGTPRYAGVVNNSDYRDAVDKLIHTTDGLAYATSPTYIQNVISMM